MTKTKPDAAQVQPTRPDAAQQQRTETAARPTKVTRHPTVERNIKALSGSNALEVTRRNKS